MEFVVIDPSGKEIDWVDPVEEDDIRQTKCYWVVCNGAFTYRFYKREGYQYIHRKLDNEKSY